MSNHFINVLVSSFTVTTPEQYDNIKKKYEGMPDVWLDVNHFTKTVRVFERVEWEGGEDY